MEATFTQQQQGVQGAGQAGYDVSPPEPQYDPALFAVPPGTEVDPGLAQVMAEVQQEETVQQNPSVQAPNFQVSPQETQQSQQSYSQDDLIRQREELIATRERMLRDQEARFQREMARLNAQPQAPAAKEPDNPFDKAVDERVNATIGARLQQMQAQQQQAQLQGSLATMISLGSQDQAMPKFNDVASLGAEALGQSAALQILRDLGPAEAGKRFYAMGVGLINSRQQAQPAAQQQGAPVPGLQAAASNNMQIQAPNNMQIQASAPQSPPAGQPPVTLNQRGFSGIPQIMQGLQQQMQQRPVPRGMQMQGQGGTVAPGRTYQDLDAMLGGDEMSFNEYDRFSKEHPELVERFLKFGTTDPSYVPQTSGPFAGSFYE
jgi:hypothetical protein